MSENIFIYISSETLKCDLTHSTYIWWLYLLSYPATKSGCVGINFYDAFKNYARIFLLLFNILSFLFIKQWSWSGIKFYCLWWWSKWLWKKLTQNDESDLLWCVIIVLKGHTNNFVEHVLCDKYIYFHTHVVVTLLSLS